MHDHTIGYYCYCHHYFFVYALQVINNKLVGKFKPLSLFLNSFYHCDDHWGKRSCLIQLNKIFFWLSWLRIFDALAFILQDTLTVFSFYIFLYSNYNFYFEVTLFVVEKIVVINKVSQVFMLIRV